MAKKSAAQKKLRYTKAPSHGVFNYVTANAVL